jgi:hypothetical protein
LEKAAPVEAILVAIVMNEFFFGFHIFVCDSGF